ncbi:IclR family transcriptional regulator [Brevibacterium sp. BRM-1]|uniref:IclR family transcriptional regulator n=1 Tax=Brevibacterium sp. BRM-1 TaxID=2999062 RepID=UPI00227E7EF6|nr:IclR family transcriptional regulator [Brevibacterium sp. BRM-1]WAL39393.1 IclR family transcriptional regulator [Brevibacterium sp. BRM-1]
MGDVPALRRAIALLRQLAGSNRPISAGALARGLDIPRSSIYELLAVLDELGFVAKAPGGYMLGAGVSELGSAFGRTNPLQRLAQPIVRRLAEDTDGTAQLSVLRGWETVYILKEQAVRSVAVITAAGVRMPAYLTATGRAMLAQLSKREVLALFTGEGAFVSRTGSGPQTVRELNGELGHERRRGYSLERGEVTPGIWTVGAPVLDALDRPVAGMGLCLPDSAYSAEAVEASAERVRAAAAELTARLR